MAGRSPPALTVALLVRRLPGRPCRRRPAVLATCHAAVVGAAVLATCHAAVVGAAVLATCHAAVVMGSRSPDAPVLPDWPPGTVVILVTAGERPHAIPVSAAVRAGQDRVLLGLAQSRGSLQRLKDDGRVAVSIIAGGDVAITAYGEAHVRDEEVVDGVTAVELTVQEIQDHNRPTFVIEAGIAWRWTDTSAQERDAQVRRALARLAGGALAPRCSSHAPPTPPAGRPGATRHQPG